MQETKEWIGRVRINYSFTTQHVPSQCMRRRKSQLLALAPAHDKAIQHFVNTQIDANYHAAVVRQIRALREVVYRSEGFWHQDNCRYEHYDSRAWHLALKSSSSQDLVGCIRVMYFMEGESFPPAESILEIGGIRIDDNKLRDVYLEVIRHRIYDVREKRKPFCYVGGLAINQDGRKVGHGALLGLAVNALSRIIGDAEGLTFAHNSRQAASMFYKLGGYPLGGGALTTFQCTSHKSAGQLIGLHSLNVSDNIERIVKALKTALKQEKVIAPS